VAGACWLGAPNANAPDTLDPNAGADDDAPNPPKPEPVDPNAAPVDAPKPADPNEDPVDAPKVGAAAPGAANPKPPALAGGALNAKAPPAGAAGCCGCALSESAIMPSPPDGDMKPVCAQQMC
jgi:hypothetical protein